MDGKAGLLRHREKQYFPPPFRHRHRDLEALENAADIVEVVAKVGHQVMAAVPAKSGNKAKRPFPLASYVRSASLRSLTARAAALRRRLPGAASPSTTLLLHAAVP